MAQNITTDVVIIGAGPVGLFGVFALGMLGLKSHVVDALPEVGGQCSALYPTKPIYDIPGYPEVLAGDLVRALIEQARPFAPTYHLGQAVIAIETLPQGGFLVATPQTRVEARAVLIACGPGAFRPNRPPIDGLATFEGRSVFYTVMDPTQFAGKTVVVAGGGDSAVDWALLLVPLAAHVHIVHRRADFRAAPASMATLERYSQKGQLTKHVPYQLAGLEGEGGMIRSVILRDLDGGGKNIAADALICCYGLATELGVLAKLDLDLDGNAIKIDPTTGATNRSGLFAAGDGVVYPHKQKLILTGFAEISAAAAAIDRYLNPGAARHHVHSTTRGVPGRA